MTSDQVRCGGGADQVLRSSVVDSMGADCERARIVDINDAVVGSVSINPRVEGGRATFELVCNLAGGRCRGSISIDGVGGPRARHGAGRIPGGPARIAPEFVEGQARPVAEADLVDLRGDLEVEAEPGRDRRRRLAGALQRASVDGRDRFT